MLRAGKCVEQAQPRREIFYVIEYLARVEQKKRRKREYEFI